MFAQQPMLPVFQQQAPEEILIQTLQTTLAVGGRGICAMRFSTYSSLRLADGDKTTTEKVINDVFFSLPEQTDTL